MVGMVSGWSREWAVAEPAAMGDIYNESGPCSTFPHEERAMRVPPSASDSRCQPEKVMSDQHTFVVSFHPNIQHSRPIGRHVSHSFYKGLIVGPSR